jgi:hypothetical protein
MIIRKQVPGEAAFEGELNPVLPLPLTTFRHRPENLASLDIT